jgi:pyruvate/2-oxoglutarate dehydrogenase complex dihydrolipoamide dehydrogenase (E3) component
MQNTDSAQPARQTTTEEYDLVILGGGTGGTIAAWTFAGQGQRVAVIDRKYIGGSCPNIACLPSKNIIHSAKVASYFRRSEEFGIAKRDFTVDMSAVRDRKRRMVTSWERCLSRQLQKNRRGIHPGIRAFYRS